MAVRSKQTGWSTSTNLLHNILKQVNQLRAVAANPVTTTTTTTT